MFTKDEVKQRLEDLRASGATVRAGYNLACFIASTAQLLQADKAGSDYALHTDAVAHYHTDSEVKMIIGKLHDVVEDSDWMLEDLRDVGFSARVVAGVDGMTHRPDEDYFAFVVRCGLNPDSRDVKLKDLHHNLDQSRNNFLVSETDRARINKYILSYNYLVDIKRGRIAAGTDFAVWMKASGIQEKSNKPPPRPSL